MSVLDAVAAVCLVLGALLSTLAGIAVLRFPDTMTRIHAATKPQVLGIVLLMLGLGLRLGTWAVVGELVLIIALQFVTAPVSAHLTVRAAFRGSDAEREVEGAATGAGDEGGRDRGGSPSDPSAEPGADDAPVDVAADLVQEAVRERRRRGRPDR